MFCLLALTWTMVPLLLKQFDAAKVVFVYASQVVPPDSMNVA